MPLPANEVSSTYPSHLYRFASTKELSLIIKKEHSWKICTLKDSKKKSLESSLSLVIPYLKEKIADINRQRQLQKYNDLQSAAEARQNELKEQEHLQQIKKQKDLLKQVVRWRKAQAIREMTRFAVRQALANHKKIKSFREFNQWVRWNLNYADSLDPVIANF